MAETRITAGLWRGRKIDTPPGHSTRPTSSKVREALFNIIGGDIVDARILDLYAGAGTFSFEALSRGAVHATLVERDRGVARLLTSTADRLGCRDQLSIEVDAAESWLTKHRNAEFDVVWLDPPYAETSIEKVLAKAAAMTSPLLVCEHRKSRSLPEQIESKVRVRAASYGQTTLSFYREGQRKND